MSGPWREPDAETSEYPGLWVHDGRQSGSITFGKSRLPVWAVIGELFHGDGWDGVASNYNVTEYGWDEEQFANFIYNLMEMRGEFGRLVCMLANAERVEGIRDDEHMAQFAPAYGDEDGIQIHDMSIEEGDGKTPWPDPWWVMPDITEPLIEQLKRCITALEGEQ